MDPLQMIRTLHQLFDLSGKVAVVTGGSRGLGLQIAEALGEYGASLVLVARKGDELEEAAVGLRKAGTIVSVVATDLGADGSAQLLVERVLREQSRLDILVNNAGAAWGAPAENYPDDAWDKVMRLNLRSVFQLTQAAARGAFLDQRSGVILNLASVGAFMAHISNGAGTVAYNASKGAVVSMTRALAAEWGPRGVRVNALAPGWFPSKMTAETLQDLGDDITGRLPLRRLGGAVDLKGAALLLVSDAGAYITGQTIVVDGGMTIV